MPWGPWQSLPNREQCEGFPPEAHLRKALHDAEKVGIAPEELEARSVLLFPCKT